jgi:hypothetical protein
VRHRDAPPGPGPPPWKVVVDMAQASAGVQIGASQNDAV